MTREYFEAKLASSINKNFINLQQSLPIDTGNLRYAATKLIKTPTGFRIYIDTSVAPYATYLDEPNSKHHKYFERAATEFAKRLSFDIGGIMKER